MAIKLNRCQQDENSSEIQDQIAQGLHHSGTQKHYMFMSVIKN